MHHGTREHRHNRPPGDRPAVRPPRPHRPPARRTELAAFLRSRRERLAPEELGLPPAPGAARPGLRREEVAQLAGVGVTWYTWLEQGRPINASVQVLEAVARTLRLDPAETEHLYRLADVPAVPAWSAPAAGPEVQQILDGLDPLPAAVVNGRFDVLAWNATTAALPVLVERAGGQRNTMWMLHRPDCCHPFVNREKELPRMVAAARPLRASRRRAALGGVRQAG